MCVFLIFWVTCEACQDIFCGVYSQLPDHFWGSLEDLSGMFPLSFSYMWDLSRLISSIFSFTLTHYFLPHCTWCTPSLEPPRRLLTCKSICCLFFVLVGSTYYPLTRHPQGSFAHEMYVMWALEFFPSLLGVSLFSLCCQFVVLFMHTF